MNPSEYLHTHPAIIQKAHTPTELDVLIDLGFGITMQSKLLLLCETADPTSPDPSEQSAAKAAYRFTTDWANEDGEMLIQVFHENARSITGDIYNAAGDSLTSDLLNVGHAEPLRMVA